MNRGLAWDNRINIKLDQMFGFEKFDPSKVKLTFDQKKDHFLPFIESFKEKGIKIVTVAGTNGKGETSRVIARELSKAGKSFALWTSPHILSVRERFIINDELISEKDFEELLGDVPRLSFYESLFYLFCLWANQQNNLDFIILEVGLGGRLDATNFFDTDLACLTSISKDHCEILGDSLSLILKEKLGICRKGIPLISHLKSGYLNGIVKDFTNKNSIEWLDLSEKFKHLGELAYWDQNTISGLTAANLILHGKNNLEIFQKSDLPRPEISPGRFEQMTLKNRGFIFIGAHNLDGLRHLVQSVSERLDIQNEVETLFALSDRSAEEISAMIDLLLSCPRLSKRTLVCEFQHPRSLPSEKIFSLFKEREDRGKENLKFAKDWAKHIQIDEPGTTLVLGSYYFIGEVQKYLLGLDNSR